MFCLHPFSSIKRNQQMSSLQSSTFLAEVPSTIYDPQTLFSNLKKLHSFGEHRYNVIAQVSTPTMAECSPTLQNTVGFTPQSTWMKRKPLKLKFRSLNKLHCRQGSHLAGLLDCVKFIGRQSQARAPSFFSYTNTHIKILSSSTFVAKYLPTS